TTVDHRAAGDEVPKAGSKPDVARKAAKVEKDAGSEQGFRCAVLDPLRAARLPLRQAQAPLRVARHDLAAAQGIATAIESLVDLQREGEHRLAHCLVAVAQDQSVVLVGGDRLFLAPFAAQGQPAEAARIDTVLIGGEADQSLREPVVEPTDQPGDK